MNPSNFSAAIQAKARHVANHLNALTPYERSLVLHEAQSIWDERDASRHGQSPVESDDDETEIAATTAWIDTKLHGLSPASRAELVHLIDGMSNAARLERLLGDEPGDF